MEDYIYNQNHIPKDQLRYAFRSSAATGCGWIAVYNALRIMGYKSEPTQLIRHFERSFPVVNGNFGTFITCIPHFFKSHGFKVKSTAKQSEFDRTAKESDACVLFFFWRSRKRFGAHYTALHYSDGNFIGYNTFGDSTSPDNYGKSLSDFIRRRHYFGAVLFAVKK